MDYPARDLVAIKPNCHIVAAINIKSAQTTPAIWPDTIPRQNAERGTRVLFCVVHYSYSKCSIICPRLLQRNPSVVILLQLLRKFRHYTERTCKMAVRITRSSSQNSDDDNNKPDWECTYGYTHKFGDNCCHTSQNPNRQPPTEE